ncbi:MAG: transglycosylase SLT domain-containing protein [Proteobacteria bacterium]|nr:transglycosylase SLT domain-containing protein [Pseudomonadota bacterium]MBS0571875.1 transglycosylase SLT domain-containing protein [Pseudomonadota bacterium]
MTFGTHGRWARAAALGLLVGLGASGARASQEASEPSALCERAAQIASEREGVPISVLTAISLGESGRRQGRSLRAWPWTVNMEGAGRWFATAPEALAYAQREFARGAQSFDIGCFQINFRWHGQNFTSIGQMFDPLANALYAARFLRQLYAEQGSWEAAAGAYHSRNPDFAREYAARFARLRSDFLSRNGEGLPQMPDLQLAGLELAPGGGGGPAAPVAPRPNTFPLLQAGSGAGLGSLVPIGNGGGAALLGTPPSGGEAGQ